MLQIDEETLLTTEEMGAARDIQKQAVGTVGLIPRRYERGILHRPSREFLEGCCIGNGIGIAYLQIEDLGAGIGQELAQAKTAVARRHVEGNNALATLAGSDKHQRSVGIKSV